MADDPKNRGKGDRVRVSRQRHEIDYLKEKYGVTGQAAAGAQRTAGPKRTKVEAYIRGKKTRG